MDYSEILKNPQIAPIANAALSFLGLILISLFVILALHTLYAIGQASMLYKKQPVVGWNRRFYPACIGLIIFISVLFKFLADWKNRSHL